MSLGAMQGQRQSDNLSRSSSISGNLFRQNDLCNNNISIKNNSSGASLSGPLSRSRSRLGLLARDALNNSESSDLSPNSVRGVNTVRSHLGLPPIFDSGIPTSSLSGGSGSSKTAPTPILEQFPDETVPDSPSEPLRKCPVFVSPAEPLKKYPIFASPAEPLKKPSVQPLKEYSVPSSSAEPLKKQSVSSSSAQPLIKHSFPSSEDSLKKYISASSAEPLKKYTAPEPERLALIYDNENLENEVKGERAWATPQPVRRSNQQSSGTPILQPRGVMCPPPPPPPGGIIIRSKILPNKLSVHKSGPGHRRLASEIVNGREYLVLTLLGKGGCGEVNLVMEAKSRQLFALKTVNMTGFNDANISECVNEVKLLEELKDTDLVIHIESWERKPEDHTMKIVMEYGGCDLSKSIAAEKVVSVLKIKYILERILRILQSIHQRGIVHADLKPPNFVWVGGSLKIIDFGISNRLQMDHTSITTLNPKGTLNFISPETITPDAFGRTKMSPKSDIWSLGCILYLMVFGVTPFQGIMNNTVKMSAIIKGVSSYPALPPAFSSTSILSVLELCFQTDPKKRPTAAELLSHPFLHEESFT